MNHFWNLTQEVGLHLHTPPTDLTRMSILAALTQEIIAENGWKEEKRKKEKENRKKKSKKFFTKRQTKNRHRMEIDGIGICSLLYKLAGTRTRELGRMK